MNSKFLLLLFLVLLLAACDTPPSQITPSYELSGPTLEPSVEVFPEVQTSEPTQRLFLGQNNPTAAAMPSGGEMPPLVVGTMDVSNPRQPIQLTAGDGTLMDGDLYMALGESAAPGVLLLAPDRAAWLDLPLRLQNAGLTVLAMDLRPNATAGDVDLMLRSLTQMELVDAAHIGIIGAEAGADLSMVACAQGSPCDALIMLSPVDEATVTGAILQYNPRPLFMSAGQDDAAFGVTELVRASARGDVTYETIPGAQRGAALLQASPALGDQIIEWLQVQLGAA
jgi:dienelactone hydrolase